MVKRAYLAYPSCFFYCILYCIVRSNDTMGIKIMDKCKNLENLIVKFSANKLLAF